MVNQGKAVAGFTFFVIIRADHTFSAARRLRADAVAKEFSRGNLLPLY
jgi:hypothetical protein